MAGFLPLSAPGEFRGGHGAPVPAASAAAGPDAPAESIEELRVRIEAEALARAECSLRERLALESDSARAAREALALEAASAREAAVRLGAAAEALVQARGRLLADLRAQAGEAVLAMARRVAGEALRVDPLVLQGLVDEVVEALGATGLSLRVSPADADRVRGALRDRGIHVIADDHVDAGMVGDGLGGTFDASLDAGFAAMRRAVDAWALSA
jgi:flagellar biosynthesis/type III secretory pathway protein FliH